MRIATMAGPALMLMLAVSACGSSDNAATNPPDQVADPVGIDARDFHAINSQEVLDDPMNNVVRAVYVCDNSERLTVDFDNPRDMATVRNSNGLAVDLHQQKAASGYWYKAGGYELRGRGADITWTVTEKAPTRCSAIH